MTRLNAIPALVLFAIGILSSPAARGVVVESESAILAWEPAAGPVEGYGVWTTWDGVPPESDPDHIVSEPSVTIAGDPGQVFSIQVAAFDGYGNWGPTSLASEDVLLAPPPPLSVLGIEGDLKLSDALLEIVGTDSQLSMEMTGAVKQLLDVSPLEPLMTEDGRFGLDQLVVGAPGEPSTVRLLEAANLDLAQGVAEVYLFGLGYGEPCARYGEAGLRIHEGSTLILGGLDLYAFDGVECVYINDLFPGAGDDPNVIAYDEGSILLYGDLDEDEVWDPDDNCLVVANADQEDPDGDGYGLACDADYNQDAVVDEVDFEIFKASYLSREGDDRYSEAIDHDGSGRIHLRDFIAFKALQRAGPGPSGLSCVGEEPCD